MCIGVGHNTTSNLASMNTSILMPSLNGASCFEGVPSSPVTTVAPVVGGGGGIFLGGIVCEDECGGSFGWISLFKREKETAVVHQGGEARRDAFRLNRGSHVMLLSPLFYQSVSAFQFQTSFGVIILSFCER